MEDSHRHREPGGAILAGLAIAALLIRTTLARVYISHSRESSHAVHTHSRGDSNTIHHNSHTIRTVVASYSQIFSQYSLCIDLAQTNPTKY